MQPWESVQRLCTRLFSASLQEMGDTVVQYAACWITCSFLSREMTTETRYNSIPVTLVRTALQTSFLSGACSPLSCHAMIMQVTAGMTVRVELNKDTTNESVSHDCTHWTIQITGEFWHFTWRAPKQAMRAQQEKRVTCSQSHSCVRCFILG